MCGIGGIFAYDPSAPPVDSSELDRIRDHMAARGPDGAGSWIAKDRRVGLAHRRLAILDLSDAAAQPMASDNGNTVLTFKGEIYNFRALRERLEAKGRSFRSDGDTEVLLKLYEEEGAASVKSLRGMFAFAIWDERRQGIFLARDPYGIKPLYYADDGKTFRFASQVKALVAGGSVPTDVDPAGAAGFLMTGSVPEPFTFHRAIRSLEAGETLFVDARGARRERYFSLAETLHRTSREPRDDRDLGAIVGEALRDSIRAHRVSDVPVGMFLSAGIDSGTLVGLMSETGARSIDAITLDFAEFRGTRQAEAPLAGLVARQYDLRHHLHEVSYAAFEADRARILHAMDQPTIDGVNVWLVSKAARAAGLKVCISGLGADELFGGYSSFSDVPRWVRRVSRLPISRLATVGARGASLLHVPLHPKALALVALGGTYPGAWFVRRGLFMPWELPELLGTEQARIGLERLDLFRRIEETTKPDPGTPFGRVMLMESSLYMRNQLLRDADWAGLAHSVEIRVPFVDRVLFERLAAPLAATEGSKKSLIAASLNTPLPQTVLDRPKSGFTVPLDAWQSRIRFGGNKRRVAGVRREHWSRGWARGLLAHAVG